MDHDKIIREFFLSQKDFIDKDARSSYVTNQDLSLKNYTNTYIRFSHWATPEELNAKKILDLGCSVGAAGAYALYHGASKYVGVDNNAIIANIAMENLTKYYNDKNFDIVVNDVENFIKNLNEDFDIVFLGRILHYINNPECFLRALSKRINFMIVIEEAHPPAFLIEYLLKNSSLLPDEKNFILNKIEYDYSFLESHYYENAFENFKNFPHNVVVSKKDAAIGTGCSIGYLKTILNGEKFTENFEMYDSIKTIFPSEYGYGIYDNRDGFKEYLVRFFKEDYGH